MSNQTTRIVTTPGVKQDGTLLDSQYYSEAVWCRFLNGKPKKIGGYRKLATFTLPIRQVHTFNQNPNSIVHVFSDSSIQGIVIDATGSGGAVYDRTPTQGFTAGSTLHWTIDTAYDMTGSGQTRIYAHAATDGFATSPIFYGTEEATAGLTPIILTDATKPATTGTASSGSTSITGVVASTGYLAGDFIRVTAAAAGGKDLFATIVSISGAGPYTFVLDKAAGASPAGTAIAHALGTSGGIVTIGPYLFYYGKYGLIANTDINNPTLGYTGDANQVNPVGSRIVKGLPIKGQGQAPAGLFWSDDAVIKVSYVGGTLTYQYDVMSSQSSILSANSVVEYDGVYYWLGFDRTLMFNGSVREVPNPLNNQWFFNNLNWTYRNKIWGTKIPRYGEIWWFFPKGTSTVCNWALVLNVREGLWYDTPITRSAGYYTQTFRYPLWGDETGKLWQHEYGMDMIEGTDVNAVDSYFVTHNMGYPMGGAIQDAPQGANAWTRIERIEPDFEQTGDMSVEVFSKEYANDTMISLGKYTYSSGQVRVDMRHQARILLLKFRSAVQHGDYHMGVTLLHLDVGDRRE